MDFSFLGYEFSIGYWDQWFVCLGFWTLFLVQGFWHDLSKDKTDRERRDTYEAIFPMFFVGVPVASFLTPFILAVVLGTLVLDRSSFLEGFTSYCELQKEFWTRWVDTDYVAIFMPVVCVLTLFLL